MAKKNIEQPFVVSHEGSFCNKCKKFFTDKTSFCPHCDVCSEDLCIISAIVEVEEPKSSEEEPKIKSITCDAIQGYVKERKFYLSKNILSKGELYLKLEKMDKIKEEVLEAFEFIPDSNNNSKNKNKKNKGNGE